MYIGIFQYVHLQPHMVVLDPHAEKEIEDEELNAVVDNVDIYLHRVQVGKM